ncbi:MAG: DNA polymerase B elongation subunit [Candidatus Alkanophagales archaeon MCA70_species_2]|nr:DNA polymerase B elongation subunit [Candidatus Alkanophaga liquidiphilum]
MELEGFLLDADYVTEDGRAVIRLWCKDEQGKHFVIFDRNFEPYFYALKEDVMEGEEELKRELLRVRVQSKKAEIRVKDVTVEEKKLLGKTRRVFKIFAEHPRHVPALRKEVERKGFTALEADVLFAIRYLIDKGLKPFGGVKAKGVSMRVDCADAAIVAAEVEYIEKGKPPQLDILAFDCEMANPYGMPSPSRDPIIIISTAYLTANGERGCKLFIKGDDEDDERIIQEFLDFIREFSPDVIVGYNSDAFDWQYIKERAKLHGIELSVGADRSTPRIEKTPTPEVNIAGRLNVDLYRVVQRDLGEVKVKTLENVAEFLGVMQREERVELSAKGIYEAWLQDKKKLLEYARADVESTLGIAERLLPLQYEFSKMTRCPLDIVARMGRGRQVEAYLSAEAFKIGELVPPKSGAAETYEGGFVLSPEEGLHENVVCLDFSAMYPTIMISFNISPDTYVGNAKEGLSVPEEAVNIAPEVGHAFRKQPDGFFKKILVELVQRRAKLKEEMKKLDKGSDAYRLLDIQQQCIKILTNSFYGYTGWGAARWYKRECAEATTAWGRHFIKEAIKMAEEMGFKVIYGDTDSIFVKLSDGSDVLKQAEELAAKISEKLPLELEVEDFFKTIFFTEKKKRYAALTADGEIVVRGLEVRRGDWCELAKEVQAEVINAILRDKSPEKAVKYVRGVINMLKSGEVPLEKLIIRKTLTKKASGYDAKQAHVLAAEKARARNIVYEVGSKVPYIILKGAEKMSERAFPADLIDEARGNEILSEGKTHHVDYNYYVKHQVIPAAHRILRYFGYDTKVFEESEQMTLDKWFS